MSLKPFFSILLVFFTFLFTTSCSEKKVESNPPNVIVIMTDDQGWGDLSSSGNANIYTPNIDSLALNGMRFNNFFVQPVCSPTRAEFLTGIYHTRLGVYDTSAGGERMNLGVETIAQVFKKAGYATAAYGKWHNGMQPPYHPNSRGFDDFYGFCSGHWGNYFEPMLEHNGELVKGNGFLPDDLFDRGMAFAKSNKEKPFFLSIPVNTPHSPMQVPDEYWNRFKDKELLMKASENEEELFTRAALAMVENIDWNVGLLITSLKENGLLENTIVVFLSDNGPNSKRWNGGLRGTKGSTDEGGVKSVCYIQWPRKIKKGRELNTIAGAIDLLPTLSNLAGINYDSDEIDGQNLSTLILGNSIDEYDRTLYNHWNGKTSVRTQNFRLDFENNLYDMTNDIEQTVDVSEIHPNIKDSLVKRKIEWEQTALTPILNKDSRPFPLGDPNADFTQLPARDAIAYGNIKRSNRWPNDSFFTNWVSENDSLTWPVEVLDNGLWDVELYYTCKPENIGTEVLLELNGGTVKEQISIAHDPPLVGSEKDRYPRQESYVKDFISLKMGRLQLKKGIHTLTLTSPKIVGGQGIDFRLLQFKRAN